ncbi:MAG: FKBP-type peptidyl-prolyl cis-trans isomerase [Candidatus Ancillula sp.]|jgi:hypothetical protein|nr:FKBP-type peptidyl-prolyl cis-trans isomerase [Candidatus Ancillula sp.]
MAEKNGNVEIEVVAPKDASLQTGSEAGGDALTNAKKPMNPAVIAGIVSVVAVGVIIAVIVLFSGIGKANRHDFGNVDAMRKIKVDTSNADSPIIEADSLSAVNDVTEASGAILIKGSGDEVKVGDDVVLDYGMYLYSDLEGLDTQNPKPSGGEKKWQEVMSTWDGKESPFTFKALDVSSSGSSFEQAATTGDANSQNELPNNLSKLTVGEKVGTIFAYLMPPVGEQNPYSTVVLFRVTALNEKPKQPESNVPEASYDVPANAPVINFDAGKPASVTVPADFQPTSQVTVKVLEEGTGEEVQSSDTVDVRYAGYLLDGTQFDSSFKRGDAPTPFPLNRVVPGFASGIVGQKIGSKLEILIPAEFGYGAQAQETIPANSYLIFYAELVGLNTDTQGEQ